MNEKESMGINFGDFGLIFTPKSQEEEDEILRKMMILRITAWVWFTKKRLEAIK